MNFYKNISFLIKIKYYLKIKNIKSFKLILKHKGKIWLLDSYLRRITLEELGTL